MPPKRRLDIDEPSPSKKTKIESPDPAFNSETDDEEDQSINTPLTPLTPRSPAPYRLKNKFCPYEGCGKVFNRPARLEEHLRSHTGDRPFKCPHPPCDKAFLRQSHLTHHVKSAHSEQRDYTCDWQGCGKSFLTATRLRRHVKAHEGREQFRCTGYPACERSFRKHATLQRHIDVDHLQLKPFPCTQVNGQTNQQCLEGFDTATQLRTHEARYHGETKYWCALCPEHDNDDTACSAGFVSYSDLQVHLKLEHPPGCQYCGLVCSSTRELQRHIDIHHVGIPLSARRSFICTVADCGKGFTKQGNLNIHIRTVHGQDKAFGCGSTDASSLAGDLITWSGINACGRSFGTKAALEGHIRTQHFGKEDMPPPPLLNKKQLRQLKKAAKEGEPSLTTFAKLTGAGYVEESGRDITCVVEECDFLFKRTFDMEAHARVAHGFTTAMVVDRLVANEALQGDQSWITRTETLAMNDQGQEQEREEEDLAWRRFLDLGEEEREDAGDVAPEQLVGVNALSSGESVFENIDLDALVNYRPVTEQTDSVWKTPETLIDPTLMST